VSSFAASLATASIAALLAVTSLALAGAVEAPGARRGTSPPGGAEPESSAAQAPAPASAPQAVPGDAGSGTPPPVEDPGAAAAAPASRDPNPPPQAPPPPVPPATGAASLPDTVAAALRNAGVPVNATAFVVLPLGGAGLALAVNAAVPLNPASTMKLVTTYAALNLLGPAYTWQTEALVAGPLRGDTLAGALVLRGSGDPGLVVEHLWVLVQRIRQQGIRTIAGDLILDKAVFEAGTYETGTLDGDVLRAYNVPPDPLLLNYKTVTIDFLPDPQARVVRVVALPQLAGMRLPAQVRAADGPCGDWKGRLQGDFSDPLAPQFRGVYPLSCGDRYWNVSVLNHADFLAGVFRALWEASGGTWTGRVRAGPTPPQARRVAVHESAPLAMVIREINKFSNNVMTRQLFLTIGAETSRQPGTPERAVRALREWYAARGMAMPELVLENGAGLSRLERISAGSLARVLAHAYASAVMPELMASLPIPGVDGTMKNRFAAVGSAHVKTGLLADVRAVAGYVLAASGRRYVVVGIVNHPNAGAAAQAHDALLQWVYARG
jgi:D-alanyl-D-alanine carboxypeptidase/D-alanyl-D-alanine-endopeptidase (penicillin-binding protein 4)